jgi:5-methylcytosine-specific restriction endonuclease McrA
MERFDVDKDSVQTLYELYLAGRVDLSPSYQRSRVWSDELRYALIDSVREEYPIGLVMLNVVSHVDEDGDKIDRFEVVDGQQRVRTLFEYLAGAEDWSRADGIRGFEGFKPFKALSGGKQDKFKQYKIPAARMKEFEQEEVRDCFLRLQYGRPLKIGEKLKALTVYPMYPYVLELTNHKLLKSERLSGRDAHWTLATAFMKAAYTKDLFGRQEFKNLETFLKTKAAEGAPSREIMQAEAKVATEKARRILNLEQKVINEALEADPTFQRYAYTARLVKWLFVSLTILSDNFGISGKEHLLAAGLLAYYKCVETEDTDEWRAYTNSGRTGRVDTKEVKACLQQMIDHMVADSASEPLDPKRFFSAQQRRDIFTRSKGRCQDPSCGMSITGTNFHADHVKPHSRGGKTVVENGRALCTTCNRKKGNTWRDLLREEPAPE